MAHEQRHKDIKASCQERLNRIEGQVRGLSKMVDEDRYCIDIVAQISAVGAVPLRLDEEILRDQVAHCVAHAISSGDKADQRRKIAELVDVVSRANRGEPSRIFDQDQGSRADPEYVVIWRIRSQNEGS